MNEVKTLDQFVAEKITVGLSKSAIQEQLTAVGWSEDQIDAAYSRSLMLTGVPVPSDRSSGGYVKNTSTVEIVLNFFSFILLGIVATALGTLLYAVINDFFPDTLHDTYWSRSYASDTIHYAIAALIIGYPLYYVSVRLWFKRFRQDETKVESRLTKWLTYLVLLVASVTIVGDLIAVLYTFLQGELTMRFFPKALTILVIAGMIFGFYYLERKKVQYKNDIPRKRFQVFGYMFTAIVVMGIILGFVVAGSPATERMRQFDDARSSDLRNLSSCIERYANKYERLPGSLTDLTNDSSFSYCADEKDPETGESYEYAVVTSLHTTTPSLREAEYQLCATFSLPYESRSTRSNESKWYTHKAGRECDAESVAVEIAVPRPAQPQIIYE